MVLRAIKEIKAHKVSRDCRVLKDGRETKDPKDRKAFKGSRGRIPDRKEIRETRVGKGRDLRERKDPRASKVFREPIPVHKATKASKAMMDLRASRG